MVKKTNEQILKEVTEGYKNVKIPFYLKFFKWLGFTIAFLITLVLVLGVIALFKFLFTYVFGG